MSLLSSFGLISVPHLLDKIGLVRIRDFLSSMLYGSRKIHVKNMLSKYQATAAAMLLYLSRVITPAAAMPQL